MLALMEGGWTFLCSPQLFYSLRNQLRSTQFKSEWPAMMASRFSLAGLERNGSGQRSQCLFFFLFFFFNTKEAAV